MADKTVVVLQTERLILRHACLDDVAFILELVNDPSWLKYIGDKNIKTLEAAQEYIRTGLIGSYEANGFGLYLTEQKANKAPIGICGLVKREGLDDPDVGFAFMPTYTRKGYGYEAASAVLHYAKNELNLDTVVAITSPENIPSIKLLEKLGLRFKENIKMSDDGPDTSLFV